MAAQDGALDGILLSVPELGGQGRAIVDPMGDLR
jgi:hypothetical protein